MAGYVLSYVFGAFIASVVLILFVIAEDDPWSRGPLVRLALFGSVIVWPITLAVTVVCAICAAAFLAPRLFIWAKKQVIKTVEEAANAE